MTYRQTRIHDRAEPKTKIQKIFNFDFLTFSKTTKTLDSDKARMKKKKNKSFS